MPDAASRSPSKKKIWVAGTLAYTSASLAALFCWLLWGDFAWQMRDRSVLPVTQLLFKHHGASDTMVGLFFSSAPLAIGLLLNPVISYLSDRHRGRWGRRVPFLMATTPVIVVAIAGLAFSSQLGSASKEWLPVELSREQLTLVYLGLFLILFEMGSSVVNMIFGALVNDVVPSTLLGRFYGLFRAVSLLAGIIFNYWIFGHAEQHFTVLFLGIAVLYGAGFSLLCIKVREGAYPPVPATGHSWSPGHLISAVGTYFKESFGHSYYWWYFAATILAGLCVTPANLYNLFYGKSLGITMDEYGKYMAYSFGISLLLAYPLGVLSDRFHPLRMTIISIVMYTVVMLASAVLVKDASSFGISLIAQSILAGCFYTVSQSIPQRLLPKERFASFLSAGGILGCAVGIMFAPMIGFLLDLSDHDYRYTYWLAFLLGTVALVANFILYKKFRSLGGEAGYIAPAVTARS